MKSKSIFTIIVVFALLLSSSIIAYAGSGSSDGMSYTVYGNDYSNWASVYTTTTTAMARTCAMCYTAGNATVPAGYIGAQARLYNSSGTLIKDTGMSWNKNAAYGYSSETPYMSVSSGYYYSSGYTQAYNGNSYSGNYPTGQTTKIYTS